MAGKEGFMQNTSAFRRVFARKKSRTFGVGSLAACASVPDAMLYLFESRKDFFTASFRISHALFKYAFFKSAYLISKGNASFRE